MLGGVRPSSLTSRLSSVSGLVVLRPGSSTSGGWSVSLQTSSDTALSVRGLGKRTGSANATASTAACETRSPAARPVAASGGGVASAATGSGRSSDVSLRRAARRGGRDHRPQRRRARAPCSRSSRGSPSRRQATRRVYGRVGSLLEVGTGFHPELTGRENIFLNGAILGMTRREIDAQVRRDRRVRARSSSSSTRP